MAIKHKAGSVVKIELESGEFCFAHVLKDPLIAFYDLKVKEIPPINVVINSSILFKVWVMKYAVTSGRWPIIGQSPLTEDLRAPVTFFKQSPMNGNLFLYRNSEIQDGPVSAGDCEGLERAAVWDPEHIEDRLRDHFLGVPNKWMESLKIK
ncbi:immunity 26/phosphotriesterase HocA family protein [Microbulbifer sp. CnH-101-G]|uniref:immunity 26/phosphotriesterase HocA family protein n=1 Tax=Microbulbifer sp. CnH-101-G TaxID=3243393 RepID=UPI00403A0967